VKNFAKVTLLSFSRTDLFLYDIMVSENDFLETIVQVVCFYVGNSEIRL